MPIYRLTNEPGGLGLSCTATGLSLGGTPLLREVEQRLRVADRMAACIEDPRAPDLITHKPWRTSSGFGC